MSKLDSLNKWKDIVETLEQLESKANSQCYYCDQYQEEDEDDNIDCSACTLCPVYCGVEEHNFIGAFGQFNRELQDCIEDAVSIKEAIEEDLFEE